MKRKRVMRTAAALCLESSMTARAAPEVMRDGTAFHAGSAASGTNPDVVN